ncbi:Fc.00g093820.m01.CDS01 [Cosmosporella sp. VM-42]
MAQNIDLGTFPQAAPARPTKQLRFSDVAVTATAKEFKGIYRNKQCHEPDFARTLERAKDAGVSKVMLTGMSLADVAFNDEVAKSHPSQCFVTVGVHPYHAAEIDEGGQAYLDDLEQAVQKALLEDPPRITAFGELGLDYDREAHASKEVQIRAFKAQLDLFVSRGWDLPLFLHCRAAFDDFVDTIIPYLSNLPRRGLVHSFVGSAAQMGKLVELGLDVSVNGFSFKDQMSLDMVSNIPLHRLQVETDAPWGELKATSEVVKRYCVNAKPLPAAKKKDKWDSKCMMKERNESCTIERVAYIVAGLKGISVEEVADAAWKNSVAMFGLGERSNAISNGS